MQNAESPVEAQATLPTRPRGIPLWVLMIGVLLFTGVGIAAFATTVIRSNVVKETTAQVLAKAHWPTPGKLTPQQNEMITLAVHATNFVADSVSALTRLRAQADDLLTNDTGRLIACNNDLVIQAERLYSEELPKLPTSAELVAKLAAIPRIEPLADPAEDTNTFSQIDFAAALEKATVFAEQSAHQTYPVRILLASLIEESSTRPDTRTNKQQSLTLGATLGQRMQAARILQNQRTQFDRYMKAAEGKR